MQHRAEFSPPGQSRSPFGEPAGPYRVAFNPENIDWRDSQAHHDLDNNYFPLGGAVSFFDFHSPLIDFHPFSRETDFGHSLYAAPAVADVGQFEASSPHSSDGSIQQQYGLASVEDVPTWPWLDAYAHAQVHGPALASTRGASTPSHYQASTHEGGARTINRNPYPSSRYVLSPDPSRILLLTDQVDQRERSLQSRRTVANITVASMPPLTQKI
jgi:hypothetical protein